MFVKALCFLEPHFLYLQNEKLYLGRQVGSHTIWLTLIAQRSFWLGTLAQWENYCDWLVMSAIYTKWKGLQHLSYVFATPRLLISKVGLLRNWICMQITLHSLVKCISWLSGSSLGPKILHSLQGLRWCQWCWTMGPTLNCKALRYLPNQFSYIFKSQSP